MSAAGVGAWAVRFSSVSAPKSLMYLQYGIYGEADGPQVCDFFFWVVRTPEHLIAIDTGFGRPFADRVGLSVDLPVEDGFQALGLQAEDVDLLLLTHLHNDHTGRIDAFPNAEVVVQRAEHDFWSGPYATRPLFAGQREESDLAELERAAESGRLRLVDGDLEIAPGVELILLPGHTPGSQLVRVRVRGADLLFTGDVVHYWEEVDKDRPFVICSDVPEAYASFETIRTLRAEGCTVITGHDRATADDFRTVHSGGGAALITDLTARTGGDR